MADTLSWKKMKYFFHALFIDILLTVIISSIYILVADEIKYDELMVCIIAGTLLFFFFFVENYLVRKHGTISTEIKYVIIKIIIFLFFIGIIYSFIHNMKNIRNGLPVLIIFKGNIELIVISYYKSRKK
jgi:hypothetical protein